jgi:hypothetical protein
LLSADDDADGVQDVCAKSSVSAVFADRQLFRLTSADTNLISTQRASFRKQAPL